MPATDRVKELFTDARAMYDSALERLAAGDIRDSAEKAWCATKRATDALILARTGQEPETTGMTSAGIRLLGEHNRAIENLVGRYYTRVGHLHGECFHGECFYDGTCASRDTERRIRETIDYVNDVETLASDADNAE